MSDFINDKFSLPLIPLRGLSVFPGMMLTFEVERESSISALSEALKSDHQIFLSSQKDVSEDVPEADGIYAVGTVCKVRQQLKIPKSNACRVMVEGLYRAKAEHIATINGVYYARLSALPDKKERVSPAKSEAALRSCLSLYEEYVQMNSEIINEHILDLIANPQPEHVSFFIAHTMRIPVEDKQSILEEVFPTRRLIALNKILNNEINILSLEKELTQATQEEVNRNQREYYLREEMKIIRAELGEDDVDDEIDEYREKVEKLAAPEEVKEKLGKEVSRLAKQPFGSSEAAVIRGYIDTCLEIPWSVFTEETIDIEAARKILEKEHYGLEKVKERIIEYLSVKKLSPEIKGGLICLVGPPGTGKTSIAMSVAKACNRKLVRIALGGIHDESEIRGHRKTYIGSMPGRIINGIIQAGTANPLMVLDEIDKLGSDYKGDPSAALLEALDPEQNSTFRDHFLELPFDLSNVFFITTANTTDTIPKALLDRMEVIEVSSYTDEEKLKIASGYLVPKQREKHGLSGRNIRFTDDAIRSIIRNYTRESGVRLLEREIASACRKAAVMVASGECTCVRVTPEKLEKLLGTAKYKNDGPHNKDEVGLVKGLAYTTVGGEVLTVEVTVVDGNGKLELTGNLGDVMKESAKAAISYIRSRSSTIGVDSDFYKNKDIHIHFPEGAVPKDGPSAGITVCTAVVSALTGLPVRHDVAMTGEITLRGRVLPIGGLKEKTMAAYREGVKTVIIPKENIPDLEDIDHTVREGLNFIPVDSADQVLEIALVKTNPESIAFAPVVKNDIASVRQ